ncbi:MAG: hypothetical protein WKF40_06095 [Thermoleophilaceae bacterium]
MLAIGALAVAVAMHWPLVLHLGEDVPEDLGDPLSQAWQVAWGGHALATQPLEYFQSNQFWPLRDSLAFSDALIGYAPAGMVGEGFAAAIARYDVLFLFAYALAFAGAHLLGRELGLGRLPAAMAGAAYAYAPWRLEQDGHMHVISSGGIPLSLFLLVRGYRRGRPGLVVAGWAVAAWQLSIGFSLGLQLAYLLGALGAGWALWWWWRRPRPRLDRRLAVATAAGVLAFAATAVVLTRPYLRVVDDHPEAQRSAATVADYSGPVWELLVAPGENLVWGPATAPLRERLNAVPEQTLFPGLTILALALAGLGAAAYGRRLRLGLGAGAALLTALALGFPGRLGAVADALLVPLRARAGVVGDPRPGPHADPPDPGLGAAGRSRARSESSLAWSAAARRVLRASRRARRGESAKRPAPRTAGKGPGPLATRAAGLALVALVLLEGSGWDLDGLRPKGPAHPTVPTPPPGQLAAPAPRLHLPTEAQDNRRYLIWSTEGFPEMVNGRSSFMPRQFAEVRRATARFPDASSTAFLRRLGVRTVIVHLDRRDGRPPPPGLGLEREVRGRIALYDLAPGARPEPRDSR